MTTLYVLTMCQKEWQTKEKKQTNRNNGCEAMIGRQLIDWSHWKAHCTQQIWRQTLSS